MRTEFFIVIIFEPITGVFFCFGLYIRIDVPKPRA